WRPRPRARPRCWSSCVTWSTGATPATTSPSCSTRGAGCWAGPGPGCEIGRAL
ncbi:MAG: hypothetical protein AVDCRST_MAG66-3066, partial [uncultured Pseudonocardia sp.]